MKLRVSAILIFAFLTVQSFAQSTTEIDDSVALPDDQPVEKNINIETQPNRKVIRSEVSISDEWYTGPAVFIGLDLGILDSVSDVPNIESNKTGSVAGFKGLFSWINESYTFDLGVGWLDSSLSGEVASADDTKDIGSSFGVAEASIRYRLNKWEIGPSAQIFFGTDTSFSPSEVTTQSATKANLFLGVNAYFGEFHWNNFGNRFGLQLMTDVTIEGRQVSAYMIQWQYGFPLVKERPKMKVVEIVDTVTTEKTKIIEKVKEKQAYLIDAGFINFQTNKSDLVNRDMEYLKDLGQYLTKRQSYWDQIVITGHADKRGSREYNNQLALKRANTVINAMGLQNLPPSRFTVVNQGFDDPVVQARTNEALAKNRRVEIEIKGPVKTKRLKRPILKIRQRHRVPSTCQGGECK